MSESIIHKTKTQNACLARCRDYLELTKPRVVLLMLLTSYVGMHLAVPALVAWPIMVFGTIGIALSAGSAAVINHLVDSKIDALMGRTRNRPIPTGKINPVHALIFSLTIGSIGLTILYFEINPLTAWLTLATLLGYAVCYTLFLKRATPQNIVIGGAAGAAPPLLGWTAVTGHIAADPLLLVLIIFVWTPPHFWALAIHRQAEYAKAKIPMLPVTHGIPFTKLCILLYTILLFVSLLLPFAIGMSGVLYLVCAILLGLQFIRHAWRLYKSPDPQVAMATFKYSIIFLMLLFIVLLMDHYLRNILWQ